MSANANVSSTRQRAALACDVCRSRRTKCDGQKPSCSFCEAHSLQCNYRSAASLTPSRTESELNSIKERVEHICSLLSMRLVDSNSGISGSTAGISLPRFGGYPIDESIISRNWRIEFPFMTIQTPSMMLLLGLNPRLAAQMVTVERTSLSTLTPPGDLDGFDIQYQDAISAFGTFYKKIHHWYPVLHPSCFDVYLDKISGNLDSGTDSCLVLLIAAIGLVAQCSSISVAYEQRPDARFIAKALSMVPDVHFEFSLRSVQCLVLLSIYYNCIGKPCQAHDYILIASCKAQAIFKCHLYDDDDPTMETLRRSFWSILLIETELAYHIDMPESNIWKFDDRILLPGIHGSWQPFHDDQRDLLDQILPTHHSAITPNDAKAYFLAEISMCRMIRRCTTSVTISHDKEVYAPIIAVELAHQLESWYDHLPPSLRFDRAVTTGPDDARNYASPYSLSTLAAVTNFLQMQYHLVLAGIYWPAIYSLIYADTSTAATLADSALFFEAYAGFITSAAGAIRYCPQSLWSIHANVFITTMAALKGANSPNLRPIISSTVLRCFTIAVEIFQNSQAVSISPSLGIIRSILTERVGNRV